jgi:hypothetical protein
VAAPPWLWQATGAALAVAAVALVSYAVVRRRAVAAIRT